MEMKEHLLKYGYDLEFSYDDDKCSAALLKSLGGRKQYNQFWRSVFKVEESNPWGIEAHIRQILANNQDALKVLLSGQIAISVAILNQMISFLQNKYPNLNGKSVLELGGFDGWAADHLTQSLSGTFNVDVVDSAGGLKPLSPRVNLITSSYEDFQSQERYDVVYSILGIPFIEIDILLNCAARCIKPNGIFLMGVRAQSDEYKEVQDRMKERGFTYTEGDLVQVKVDLDTGTQYLPVFKFNRA